MSLSASCEAARQKRSLSSLLDGHLLKRPKQGDGRRLQEAAIQLLEQQQDLCSLFKEIGATNPSIPLNVDTNVSEDIPSAIEGSLLVFWLRRQSRQHAVPLATLSVKLVMERLSDIAGCEEDNEREILTHSQRAQLCALLESSRELLAHGCLCPKLLWQEYRKYHKLPKLEVVAQLNFHGILKFEDILKSDEGVRSWLVPKLKDLCSWTPPQEEEELTHTQQKVLSGIVGLLVSIGFQSSHEQAAMEKCSSTLDAMLFWFLDTADLTSTQTLPQTATNRWCQLLDTLPCQLSASPDAIQRFFTHSLTQTLTYKPQLPVSDAIRLQNKWTFAKASRWLTCFFHKLTVIFSVKQLLHHLQQVLETHEVNWKHVLCFLSTLLVYNPSAQPDLRELLSRLLTSAFEGYDLESMITAFLLARQGALQGPAIFPSYVDWFKESFGGASGVHTTSKKSLVFLLKFLSDLVPFEPPQYLKVHILHPPYVPVKYRSLLMDYVSLAKTRLADLKESVEEMGLYGDVSTAGAAPVQVVQDVDKALSLFESTGRISATVMEASIFRRSYFLTRFLPTLLKPKVLPVKADTRMKFIAALKKAEKIPAAQYSAYVDSCQRQRQQQRNAAFEDRHDHLLQDLKVQLQELTEQVVDGNEGDMSSQVSKISHTLSFIFPGLPDDALEQEVIQLQSDTQFSELHMNVAHMVLRGFCQCMLNASRVLSPNKQMTWASRFVSVLACNTQLLSCLLHRLWDLIHNQGALLTGPHLLGLAAFVVHLHACTLQSPLVHLVSLCQPKPVSISEALSSALVCSTRSNMLFCVRFCVAAVCYRICRVDSWTQHQHDLVPVSFCKKLQYLIPRLLPEARAPQDKEAQEMDRLGLWRIAKDISTNWKKTAWCLWRHPAFCQLQQAPHYRLLFTEWLANELQVERSKDVLFDSERLEYQRWACLHFYLTRPEDQGGCGGSMKSLVFHLINAIMGQQFSQEDHTILQRGSCVPDIICTLQQVVYEMESPTLVAGHPGRADICDFLFECASQRFSASAHLSCEHTLNMWNRILLALPSVSLVKIKTEEGSRHLDCSKLIQHVNQHQRSVCSPDGLLSFHLTSHFLRGILHASARCNHVGEEFNKTWSHISEHCPLLLVSTAYWWEWLSTALMSLWYHLCDGETPPEQLQNIASSQRWACSLMGGQLLQLPSAPALLLASSLYECQSKVQQDVHALILLQPERDLRHREVLVFLLFLGVNDYVSAVLHPQEKCYQKALKMCTDILTAVVDAADWLLIFQPNKRGVYESVAMVMSDKCTQLMPWVFYSVLLEQSAELQHRAMRCPGFLSTAVSCYVGLLQLFLDGHNISQRRGTQTESCQILGHTKRFLLKAISLASPSSTSSRLLAELETQCVDLDPEVAAALSTHLDLHRLPNPDMDFL